MTKQKPSHRKALRSAAAKKGSLRRKTPAHPFPAAMQASDAGVRLWSLREDLHRAAIASSSHKLFTLYGAWGSRLALGLIDLGVVSGTSPKPEMGAEARSAEPVQSDPNPWPRITAWIRKLVGR